MGIDVESRVELARRYQTARGDTAASGRLWHRRLRDAFVAALSAAILAFLAFYALSRPDVRLETALGPVEAAAAAGAVVHGRIVLADGRGVDGARLVVSRLGQTPRRAMTGERGFFRVQLGGSCGTYAIDLAARGSGRSFARRFVRRLCPGQALEIDARIVSTGNFVWFPTR